MLTAKAGRRLASVGHAPFVICSTILVASLGGWWLGERHDTLKPRVTVLDALDGDTLVVELPDGSTDTVRILGVDTPETHHPTIGVECFGPEAAAYTERRLVGRVVALESDVETHDLYGRRLSYVHLHGVEFGEELLRKGYARLLVIAPNRAHARDLLRAEIDARHERRGLWGHCGGE
jgi:micrococcal nuclease